MSIVTSFTSAADWLWLAAFGGVPLLAGVLGAVIRRRPKQLVASTEADAAARRQ